MVNLIISSVGTTLNLQRRCPRCGRNNGSIHSATRRRRISGIKVDYITQRRMRCPWCGTTWTIRVDGIGRGWRRAVYNRWVGRLWQYRHRRIHRAVEKLVRRYGNRCNGVLWKINQMLQHIERTWEKPVNHFRNRTNNTTGRIIGLDYKIRAKTMRGLKSWQKALNHCYLSEYLRGEDGVCDLRKVV